MSISRDLGNIAHLLLVFADTLVNAGIRTAWSSSVFVHGREYRAALWRDYRYLEQSREEAAEVAWKALQSAAATTNANQTQYNRSFGTSR